MDQNFNGEKDQQVVHTPPDVEKTAADIAQHLLDRGGIIVSPDIVREVVEETAASALGGDKRITSFVSNLAEKRLRDRLRDQNSNG